MERTVEIVDTEDKLTIRVNGVLLYNYHGPALQVAKMVYSRNHLIRMVLQQHETVFDMFLEQLRSEGYFDEKV